MRKTSKLSNAVQDRLNLYVLAATAAGLGVLAQPAEAKIVYTKANHIIAGLVTLDLNHDGNPDFGLCRAGSGTYCTFANTPEQPEHRPNPPSPFGQFLIVEPPTKAKTTNVIWGHSTFRQSPAAPALPSGFYLGGKLKFVSGVRLMATWGQASGGSYSGGPWKNAEARYLGLKFVIKGKVHYGWARLNVSAKSQIEATLTGYAYETVPNKGIVTGKTKGPDVITLPEGSLGELARGRR